MTVAELAQGLRIYRDWLIAECQTAKGMVGRDPSEPTLNHWIGVKEACHRALDKLERQFPYLREL